MDDDTLQAWDFQEELNERRWEYEGMALQPEGWAPPALVEAFDGDELPF